MKENNGQYPRMVNIPEVGDKIYIPNEFYCYRGKDDVKGGTSTITHVEKSTSAGEPTLMVRATGTDTRWNWQYLEPKQEELKNQFGDEVARPNPDYRPEYNKPNADWH